MHKRKNTRSSERTIIGIQCKKSRTCKVSASNPKEGGSKPEDTEDIFYKENDRVSAELVRRCAFCNKKDGDLGEGIITGGWLPFPLVIAKRPLPRPPRMSYIHRNCAAFSSQVYSKYILPNNSRHSKVEPLSTDCTSKHFSDLDHDNRSTKNVSKMIYDTVTLRIVSENSNHDCFNGKDHGIVWYNILREVRRGRCLKCCLCGEKGATMTCNNPKCHATA